MTNPIGTSDKTYLPTLETVAQDKQTRWKRLTVQEWREKTKDPDHRQPRSGTTRANLHARKQRLPVQQTAWYLKKLPTFSDARCS
ncbi:MAG TPA: hypothetical protein VK206_06580 [Anaerolineales bacterium]|nr:hypothetical protein [Anaerolineales bacterium]